MIFLYPVETRVVTSLVLKQPQTILPDFVENYEQKISFRHFHT